MSTASVDRCSWARIVSSRSVVCASNCSLLAPNVSGTRPQRYPSLIRRRTRRASASRPLVSISLSAMARSSRRVGRSKHSGASCSTPRSHETTLGAVGARPPDDVGIVTCSTSAAAVSRPFADSTKVRDLLWLGSTRRKPSSPRSSIVCSVGTAHEGSHRGWSISLRIPPVCSSLNDREA